MSDKTSIQTYSGKQFDVLEPEQTSICIEDIAHALSQINRFNGHTVIPYSVAEHSVHVASLVPKHMKLEALLHDASEAYIADLSTPVKQTTNLEGYRILEKNIQRRCEYKFGVVSTEETNIEIKKADRIMLKLEALILLKQPLIGAWVNHIEDIKIPEIHPWPEGWVPSFAKFKFLQAFDILYGIEYN